MANLWVPNGASCITAPTLGDVTAAKLKFTFPINWETLGDQGYIFSQAEGTSAAREIGAFVETDGEFRIIAGGANNVIGTVSSIFGSTRINDTLVITILADGTTTIEGNSATYFSGTITRGGTRQEGCLFRIGARGDLDGDVATDNNFIIGSAAASVDASIGDLQVEVNDVLVRNYIMPPSGVTVTDSANGQNGTLQAGTGDGSDWQVQNDIDPPIISLPGLAVDPFTKNLFVPLTGSYFIESPTTIEYRVMRGASEVFGWTSVDSFSDGTYTINSAQTGVGVGLTIQVRVDGGTTYASNAFDAGRAIGLVGSSSSQNMETDGTATCNGRIHVKERETNNFATYDNEIVGGQTMVAIANAIHAATGEPVIFYCYGLGGTEYPDWTPPSGASYVASNTNIDASNVSIWIDQLGYNSAYNGATVNQATVQAYWDGLRGISAAPIICGFSQRNIRVTENNAEFVALWQSQQAAVDANAYAYPLYRHHYEISGDSIHLTQADADASGEAFAAVVLSLSGDASYRQGPTIQSASVSGSAVIVALNRTNTDYTAISPSSALSGFRVTDSIDGVIAISSSSVTADSITLNLAAPPSGTLTLDFAGYEADYAGGNAATNYPVANSSEPMPLAPLFSGVLVSVPGPEDSRTNKGPSRVKAAGGNLTIDGEPHVNGAPVSISPQSGLTSRINGRWTATLSADGSTVEVDGANVGSRAVFYVGPDGRLSTTPNGAPVGNLK